MTETLKIDIKSIQVIDEKAYSQIVEVEKSNKIMRLNNNVKVEFIETSTDADHLIIEGASGEMISIKITK
ncbi:hypothetical protein [Parasutterella muris]|uniref:hypothetical protein n=1 Tax=Parasutterella muris TaxID=2565572 RepID=UPI00203E4419|nr:hypothetical protein [Parasutterella muris]